MSWITRGDYLGIVFGHVTFIGGYVGENHGPPPTIPQPPPEQATSAAAHTQRSKAHTNGGLGLSLGLKAERQNS